MTNKVPNIRFKGFTDDWEQRKVSDVSDRYDNLRVPVAANLRIKGSTPYYGANGIQDYVEGYTHDGEFVLVAEDGANDLKNYPVNYVNGRVWVNNHAHVLQAKESIADNRFIGYAISRANIESVLVGGGRAKLNAEVLMDISLKIPTKKEQVQISSFISSLDHLITLHQRKCEQTKELKKYMLQKMFPKKGEKNPEIRFPGFTDDWEQRKLGEVVEDYIEKTTVEDQYPVLTSSQQKGIVLQEEYFAGNRVSQNGNIGYFVIPRGYFAFRSRSDNDTFVFNRNDAVDMGIISYFYPVFKPKGVDSDFLLRRLNYGLENQIKINSEGTGQHVLSLKKFKNMIGSFPSYEEQQKIGEYFSNLDHLITLHQRKCEQLKELKKFMLQNMFPKKG